MPDVMQKSNVWCQAKIIALILQGACPHVIANLEGKANARCFDCPTLLVEVLAQQLVPNFKINNSGITTMPHNYFVTLPTMH